MRISVYDVLDWLAQGMTQADIMADYPELSVDDIRAAVLSEAVDLGTSNGSPIPSISELQEWRIVMWQ